MPLDRRITLIVATYARNQYGESEETSTRTDVWAARTDRSLADVSAESGARDEGRRDWRVRWTATLAGLLPTALSVVDDGRVWDVVNVVEVPDARRRFVDIQGVVTT